MNYKLDPTRMWFSVFGGDDEVGPDEEAEEFWEQVGAPRERILRFGRKDNFWQMGETGPCGPCSEIHYYMGDDPNDRGELRRQRQRPGRHDHGDLESGLHAVRSQLRSSPASIKLRLHLPAPSVDTGMGLERLAVVLQGVKSNYDTDLIQDQLLSSLRKARRSKLRSRKRRKALPCA